MNWWCICHQANHSQCKSNNNGPDSSIYAAGVHWSRSANCGATSMYCVAITKGRASRETLNTLRIVVNRRLQKMQQRGDHIPKLDANGSVRTVSRKDHNPCQVLLIFFSWNLSWIWCYRLPFNSSKLAQDHTIRSKSISTLRAISIAISCSPAKPWCHYFLWALLHPPYPPSSHPPLPHLSHTIHRCC
jgi:hypothetical protein